MSVEENPCPQGRHGFNIRSRTDGSRICTRCKQEWAASPEVTAAPMLTGCLPTMEQQERQLFDDLATNDEPEELNFDRE